MDNEKGREVKAHYLSVGRRMRAYSASLHEQWYATVESQLLALLRRTLLVTPLDTRTAGQLAATSDTLGHSRLDNQLMIVNNISYETDMCVFVKHLPP